MFIPYVLEEKYPIDTGIYYKIYYGDSLVAADAGNTLRVWTLQGELMWWQYPLHGITCVALQGFQIAVGTEDGSVHILYCHTKNMKIEELNKLKCYDDSCIHQIRFLAGDRMNPITRCMFFQPNKISIFEWKPDTIKKVKEKLPEAIDVPGEIFYHLDAIQKAENPSEYLLFGINKGRNAISVRLVNCNGFSKEVKPTWHLTQADSEIQILDISSHGWVLLAEDTGETDTRGVRLINLCSNKTLHGDTGFMCGCLLSTTEIEASFVIQDIMPSALRAYKWNANEREPTLLQTWGTPSTKNETGIQKCVAGYNGNFIMVWDHRIPKREECAALLFCQDPAKCATFCQDSPSIYPQPYKPSWLQPDSESNEIIDSAYWRNNSGALLVRRNPESYYVRCWTYDGNNFRRTEELAFNRSRGKVKYTRIAMHENIVAVCSEIIRNSVTVQLWRENDGFSEIFEIDKVNSGIIKLINLQSRQFCLITGNELIVFEDNFLQKRCHIRYAVKDACFDPKSCQLKVLTSGNLMIYNTDLGLTQSHKHSKIVNEQIAMNSSGEDWVTIDDSPTLKYFTKGKQILFRDFDDSSTLVYFTKGKQILFRDFDNTLSLNLLSDKNVIIKNNIENTMQCYSLQNKDLTLIWDLSCETGPREWQVKESGRRYFLLTEYTFGVIELDQGVYKERILFGFKERDLSETYLPSGTRILGGS
jgi:hypothetical protein